MLRRLYAGESVDAEGRFNSFSGVSVSPVPPPIPVYLAGNADAALDRIGRLADGWLGFFVTPKGFQRSSAAIDAARERAGRIGQPFERGLLLHFLLDDSQAAVTKALEHNFGFPSELKLEANEEQLKKLFEPYFTTKKNGMGLGLVSTLNIIKSHKALIEVDSRPESGTAFRVIFPENLEILQHTASAAGI